MATDTPADATGNLKLQTEYTSYGDRAADTSQLVSYQPAESTPTSPTVLASVTSGGRAPEEVARALRLMKEYVPEVAGALDKMLETAREGWLAHLVLQTELATEAGATIVIDRILGKKTSLVVAEPSTKWIAAQVGGDGATPFRHIEDIATAGFADGFVDIARLTIGPRRGQGVAEILEIKPEGEMVGMETSLLKYEVALRCRNVTPVRGRRERFGVPLDAFGLGPFWYRFPPELPGAVFWSFRTSPPEPLIDPVYATLMVLLLLALLMALGPEVLAPALIAGAKS